MFVEALSKRTNVPVTALWNVANSASKRYFEFTLKKADGSPRTIHHPSRTLKAIQRLISRNLVEKSQVHFAATAYSKGSKIHQNALRHAATSFTTRLDFENFFPSFDENSIQTFFTKLSDQEALNLTNDDLNFLTKIVCRHGILAIGAPSSPKITNAMMFQFDSDVQKIADDHSVIYTRYADDIFISSFEKDILKCVEPLIEDVVAAHKVPTLKLKKEKTLHLSRSSHRSVTGLTITPDGRVSLGRSRKRSIKTLTFLGINGKLSFEEKMKLFGLLSFAHDNEPEFLTSLSKKFSFDVEGWFKAG